MKLIKLRCRVNSNIALILLTFLVLLGATDVIAESSTAATDYVNTVDPVDTELFGLNYRTHDNGNYHRYHTDNTIKHMQSPGDQSKNHKGSKKPNLAGQKYIGLRSGYRFRRYGHHQLELGIYDDGYNGRYSSGHHSRKYFNTLIGGTILYHLFK